MLFGASERLRVGGVVVCDDLAPPSPLEFELAAPFLLVVDAPSLSGSDGAGEKLKVKPLDELVVDAPLARPVSPDGTGR
jgi:hypothetical protein